MAKDAEDREDLLREASGYLHRVELRIPGVDHEVFCGFRLGGAFSLYWGQNSVFQFNIDGELRRAFWQDRMVASYKRELHWLGRNADSSRMHLLRTPFADAEANAFEAFAAQCLSQLSSTLHGHTYQLIGQRPNDVDVCQRLASWLDQHADRLRLAMHPGVGRKK